jgi:hypothetical protein
MSSKLHPLYERRTIRGEAIPRPRRGIMTHCPICVSLFLLIACSASFWYPQYLSAGDSFYNSAIPP